MLFSFVCTQNLSVKKYFQVEEDRLKDFLKREELWAKQKKEAEELKKKTVSHVESDCRKTEQALCSFPTINISR